MKKRIIGFAGRKRAGKTSLATYLTRCHEGTIVTVADALKNLVCDLLGFETIEELNYYKDNGTSWSFDNEKYAPIWAKTVCEQVFGEYTDEQYNEIVAQFNEIYTYNVREILQFVGTGIIRKYKPNWHVDKMVEAINNAKTELVCVDDIRFPNEREAVEALGGTVFFIIRPDLSIDISNHESEVSLTWPDFEDRHIIINMFDLPYVFDKIEEAYGTGFHLTSSIPIFGHSYGNFEVNENPYFGYIGKYKPYDLNFTGMSVDVYNLIKQVILGNITKHDGCILLHPTDEHTMNQYNLWIRGRVSHTPTYNIVVWNPFIIENIKAWL